MENGLVITVDRITLQIETGVAGVGNTIRSSNTLDLVTNGSAFKLELDTTNAIWWSKTFPLNMFNIWC